MKISFHDIINELLRHSIIHLISRDEDTGNKIIADTHKNNGMIDITFTINGVELPVLEWFNRLDIEIERMVEKKAEEIMNEKLFEVDDSFNDIISNIKDHLRKKVLITRDE
jgi:hypothetical protein